MRAQITSGFLPDVDPMQFVCLLDTPIYGLYFKRSERFHLPSLLMGQLG